MTGGHSCALPLVGLSPIETHSRAALAQKRYSAEARLGEHNNREGYAPTVNSAVSMMFRRCSPVTM
jgi:hypothetical protein